MIRRVLLLGTLFSVCLGVWASEVTLTNYRMMWGSVNAVSNASTGTAYTQHNGKLLLSWRMLPSDDVNTSFDLFYTSPNAADASKMYQLTATPIKKTNYQLVMPTAPRVFYLVEGGKYSLTGSMSDDERETIQTEILRHVQGYFEVTEQMCQEQLPYISIPLKSTEDVCTETDLVYQANDCSVGDLDGDGVMEIVVKRLLTSLDADGNVVNDGTAAGESDSRARHTVIWDAYKLDGTLMWRLKSGPNIILGNSSNFAVADLDGDGCCEVVTKTGEGTIFGDGTEIGDTDGDGITDYRSNWLNHYTGPTDKGSGGPEFFSVIDGKTGRELARADFICATDRGSTWLEQSLSWGDNYWKRANSLRVGVASFTGEGLQVFLGRGIYARTVVEGWKYENGSLTRMWKFDSSDEGGEDKNKDGKPYSAYAAQGNHAFVVGDLDGDGKDEVMYGSCAFDDDGTGLWSSGLGHGDASHVGKFLPERDGMQVYHCLESGTTQVALHDAKSGAILWKKEIDEENDMGRCMVADIDPNSPGCEFWMGGNVVYDQIGGELGYNAKSCNMGIWFDGSLSRQLLDGNVIDALDERTFTISRYDVSYNNGSKKNPGWYGDMLGDWREEIIMPDATKLADIKIFTTWYPTDHRFPWLMTDHHYHMQCIHQQVGYNQPNNLGYYLGTDIGSDSEAWVHASQGRDWTMEMPTIPEVPEIPDEPTAIKQLTTTADSHLIYNMQGQQVERAQRGIYITNGKKFIRK